MTYGLPKDYENVLVKKDYILKKYELQLREENYSRFWRKYWTDVKRLVSLTERWILICVLK